MTKKALATLLAILAIALGTWWYLFVPRNYEDCVMLRLSEMQTSASVASLEGICRTKFPEKYLSVDPNYGIDKDLPDFNPEFGLDNK